MITYSKLYEDIATTLNKSNLDAEIAGRVRIAELAIYRFLKIDLNLTQTILTEADDPINPITLPADYKQMKLVSVNDRPMERISDQRYQQLVVNINRQEPTWAFAEINNLLYLLPWRDESPADPADWGTVKIQLDYYGLESTDLMNMGYDAFLYGGLYHMAIFMKAPTDQIALYRSAFDEAVVALDRSYKDKIYAGSTKTIRSAYDTTYWTY